MFVEGKLNRYQVERAFLQSLFDVSAFAKEAITKAESAFPKGCLIDYGINSIDYCGIVFQTLEQFGISQPPINLFSKTNDMDEIVDLLVSLIEHHSDNRYR